MSLIDSQFNATIFVSSLEKLVEKYKNAPEPKKEKLHCKIKALMQELPTDSKVLQKISKNSLLNKRIKKILPDFEYNQHTHRSLERVMSCLHLEEGEVNNLESYSKLVWIKGHIPRVPGQSTKEWNLLSPSKKIAQLVHFLAGSSPEDEHVQAIVIKAWDYIDNLTTDEELLKASEEAKRLPLTIRTKDKIRVISFLLSGVEKKVQYDVNYYLIELLIRDSEYFKALFGGGFRESFQQIIEIDCEPDDFDLMIKAQYYEVEFFKAQFNNKTESDDVFRVAQELQILSERFGLCPSIVMFYLLDSSPQKLLNADIQKEFLRRVSGVAKGLSHVEIKNKLCFLLIETYFHLNDPDLQKKYLDLITSLKITRLEFLFKDDTEKVNKIILACQKVEKITFKSMTFYDDSIFKLENLSSVVFENCCFLNNFNFINFLFENNPILKEVTCLDCEHSGSITNFSEEAFAKTYLNNSSSAISIPGYGPAVQNRLLSRPLEKAYVDFDQLSEESWHAFTSASSDKKFSDFSVSKKSSELSDSSVLSFLNYIKEANKLEINARISGIMCNTIIANCLNLKILLLCTEEFNPSFKNLTYLTSFKLDCSTFNDEALETLVTNCKQLTELFIIKTELLTDTSMTRIAENCPKLKKLVFPYFNITDKGIKKLVKDCKEIEELHISRQPSFNTCRSLSPKFVCPLPSLSNIGWKSFELILNKLNKLKVLEIVLNRSYNLYVNRCRNAINLEYAIIRVAGGATRNRISTIWQIYNPYSIPLNLS